MEYVEDFRNAIRLEAERAAHKVATPRVGTISAYNPTNGYHAVRVTFQEETDDSGTVLESGWIPNAPIWSGNNWGLFAAPVIGAQVVVGYIGGSRDHGFVMAHLPNQVDKAPNVPTGELWLVHSTGASIKFNTAGNLSMQDNIGSVLTFVSGVITAKDKKGSSVVLSNDGKVVTTDPKGATISLNNGLVLLSDPSGSVVQLTNDGNVSVTATAAVKVTAPMVTMSGELDVLGPIKINGTIVVAP